MVAPSSEGRHQLCDPDVLYGLAKINSKFWDDDCTGKLSFNQVSDKENVFSVEVLFK